MAVGCPGESVPETRNQGFQIGGLCWLVHGAFPTCFLCRLPTPRPPMERDECQAGREGDPPVLSQHSPGDVLGPVDRLMSLRAMTAQLVLSSFPLHFFFVICKLCGSVFVCWLRVALSRPLCLQVLSLAPLQTNLTSLFSSLPSFPGPFLSPLLPSSSNEAALYCPGLWKHQEEEPGFR